MSTCNPKRSLTAAFSTLATWFVLIFLATASSHAARFVEEFQPGVKWGGRSVAIGASGLIAVDDSHGAA